jgi:hypothetical protein
MRRLRAPFLLLALLLICPMIMGAGVASSAPTDVGWQTSVPSMLEAQAPGSSVQPIITVGEVLPGGYRFESIPDGISFVKHGFKRADVYVNHETSTVPFPFVAGDPNASFADFTNALVSKLDLKWSHAEGVGVKKGEIVIPHEANYQRFCSNFIVGPAHGFDREILFTNEEATDFVYRTGQAWPVVPGDPAAEQAGVVVAYDIHSGEYKSIYGMGRHNHENSVGVPGYGHPVVLSGDDTFSAPASQMYLYTAEDTEQVLADEGQLWAFKSDDPATNDYGDLSGTESVSGEFIPVPEEVAKGDQTALENWSNANGVFQFIRIEDIAYNRTTPNVVYFADTGEPRAIPDDVTGRLKRGPSGTLGPYPNGRLFKMVLNASDPTQVDSLSIEVDGDAGGYNNSGVFHQPDNIETTTRSILIQEDPGSHQRFPGATNARIWKYSIGSGALEVVAEVDQSLDPAAAVGEWESSGIIDASAVFGQGAFLVDVQAHSRGMYVMTDQIDVDGDGDLDVTRKLEGGQLLLFRLPGA